MDGSDINVCEVKSGKMRRNKEERKRGFFFKVESFILHKGFLAKQKKKKKSENKNFLAHLISKTENHYRLAVILTRSSLLMLARPLLPASSLFLVYIEAIRYPSTHQNPTKQNRRQKSTTKNPIATGTGGETTKKKNPTLNTAHLTKKGQSLVADAS